MKVRQESADLSKVLKACGVNTNCLVLTNQLTKGGADGPSSSLHLPGACFGFGSLLDDCFAHFLMTFSVTF